MMYTEPMFEQEFDSELFTSFNTLQLLSNIFNVTIGWCNYFELLPMLLLYEKYMENITEYTTERQYFMYVGPTKLNILEMFEDELNKLVPIISGSVIRTTIITWLFQTSSESYFPLVLN